MQKSKYKKPRPIIATTGATRASEIPDPAIIVFTTGKLIPPAKAKVPTTETTAADNPATPRPVIAVTEVAAAPA